MLKPLRKCIRRLFLATLLISVIGLMTIVYLYQPLQDGTIELEGFDGKITITRETKTGIAHIKADTLNQVLFGQGFAEA